MLNALTISLKTVKESVRLSVSFAKAVMTEEGVSIAIQDTVFLRKENVSFLCQLM